MKSNPVAPFANGGEGSAFSPSNVAAPAPIWSRNVKGVFPLDPHRFFRDVAQCLEGKFDGNISCYAGTVKLDLETRKLIHRTITKPQKCSLK